MLDLSKVPCVSRKPKAALFFFFLVLTLLCSQPVLGLIVRAGDVNISNYYSTGVGNCTGGSVVQNVTGAGVDCFTPSGSGDITAVNTLGPYLVGGAGSGDVSLTLNDTVLNTTIDNRAGSGGNSTSEIQAAQTINTTSDVWNVVDNGTFSKTSSGNSTQEIINALRDEYVVLWVQANNATDIEATYDLCTSGNCLIRIPCGTYNLPTDEGDVNMDKDNTSILGSGKCTTINYYGTVRVFYIEDVDNTEIGNLRINLNKSGPNQQSSLPPFADPFGVGWGIATLSADINATANGIYIHDVRIEGGAKGIGLGQLDNHNVSDVTIENVYINSRNGIAIGGEHIKIDKFTLIGVGNYTVGSSSEHGEGIELNTRGARYATISNGDVSNFGEQGIDLNMDYVTLSNVNIQGVVGGVSNESSECLQVGEADWVTINNVILGNCFTYALNVKSQADFGTYSNIIIRDSGIGLWLNSARNNSFNNIIISDTTVGLNNSDIRNNYNTFTGIIISGATTPYLLGSEKTNKFQINGIYHNTTEIKGQLCINADGCGVSDELYLNSSSATDFIMDTVANGASDLRKFWKVGGVTKWVFGVDQSGGNKFIFAGAGGLGSNKIMEFRDDENVYVINDLWVSKELNTTQLLVKNKTGNAVATIAGGTASSIDGNSTIHFLPNTKTTSAIGDAYITASTPSAKLTYLDFLVRSTAGDTSIKIRIEGDGLLHHYGDILVDEDVNATNFWQNNVKVLDVNDNTSLVAYIGAQISGANSTQEIVAALVGENIQTNSINTSSVNTSELWIDSVVKRKLVSTAAGSASVCASGCTHTTCQGAVNSIPYINLHTFSLQIYDGTYDEVCIVPPIWGVLATTQRNEGVPINIVGNQTDPSGVKIKAMYVSGVGGAMTLTLSGIRFIGNTSPVDNEKVGLAIYGAGANSVGLDRLQFGNDSGNAVNGMVIYDSKIVANNLTFDNLKGYAMATKKNGIIRIEGGGAYGNVAGNAYVANAGGVIYFSNASTLTGANGLVDPGAGWIMNYATGEVWGFGTFNDGINTPKHVNGTGAGVFGSVQTGEINSTGRNHIKISDVGTEGCNALSTLCIEKSDHNLVNILAASNSLAGFYFGDNNDNDIGQFGYHNLLDSFLWTANTALVGAWNETGLTIRNGGYFRGASSIASLGDINGSNLWQNNVKVLDVNDNTSLVAYIGAQISGANSTQEIVAALVGENINLSNGNLTTTGIGRFSKVGVNTELANMLDTFTVTDGMDLLHTSTQSDDHAFEIEFDAAGFGDAKALLIDYTTGVLVAEKNEEVIFVNIDQFLATGGHVTGLEVVTTEGAAKVTGLEVGVQVDPILHQSGVFGDMDSALDNADNVLASFISTTNDTALFENDNEFVVIGNAVKFEEIEFIFDTEASGAGIKPKFYHSTGVDAWAEFSPGDGTNGMRGNGIIIWSDSDLTNWVVGTGGEFLIRINRTANSLTTAPIEDKVQIASVVEYSWDKDGNITASKVSVADMIVDRKLCFPDNNVCLMEGTPNWLWLRNLTNESNANLRVYNLYATNLIEMAMNAKFIPGYTDVDKWMMYNSSVDEWQFIVDAGAEYLFRGGDVTIEKSADPIFTLKSGDNQAYFDFDVTGSDDYRIYNNYGDLTFRNTGDSRNDLVIDDVSGEWNIAPTGGHVGIRTSDPNATLHVAGSILASEVINGSAFWQNNVKVLDVNDNTSLVAYIGAQVRDGNSTSDIQATQLTNTSAEIIAATATTYVDVAGDTGITGELRTSSFVNYTLASGIIQAYSNGCLEKVNASGVYTIC